VSGTANVLPMYCTRVAAIRLLLVTTKTLLCLFAWDPSQPAPYGGVNGKWPRPASAFLERCWGRRHALLVHC
jgi:hypothetical protein